MEDLYSSLKPSYFATKIIGSTSYKISSRNGFESCLFNIIYGLVVLTIHTYVDFCLYMTWFKDYKNLEPIYKFVFLFQAKANSFLLIFMFISIIYSRKQQIALLTKVSLLDEQLKKTAVFPNHTNIYKYSKSRISLELLFLITYTIVQYNFNEYVRKECLIKFIINDIVDTYMKFCCYIQFEILILLICERFDALHSSLQSAVEDLIINQIVIIKKTTVLLRDLTNLTRDVNKIYSVQLLLIVSYFFVTILLNIYHFCCDIIDYKEKFNFTLFLDAFWSLYYFLIMINFCRLCSKLKNKVI